MKYTVKFQKAALIKKSPPPPGKIGPPTLNVTRIEDKILTNIIHPLVVHNGEVKGPICDEDDTCYSFDYYMYIRVNGSKVCSSLSSSVKMEISL